MVTMIENRSMFENLIKEGVSLVDFYADWCGPCKMIAPIVHEIAHEYEGKVNVLKVDVDELQDIAARYGIRSIPTLFIFKNGQVVSQKVGYQPKANLTKALDEILNK